MNAFLCFRAVRTANRQHLHPVHGTRVVAVFLLAYPIGQRQPPGPELLPTTASVPLSFISYPSPSVINALLCDTQISTPLATGSCILVGSVFR